jgi:NNP family nitrate/nitrite transporter-like MFS transporter
MAGGSFAVGIAYVSKWYPAGKAGHRARHFRRRQCRRGGHQVCRAVRAGAYGLGSRRADLGRRLAIAVVFFLFTKDDPELAAREGAAARSHERCWPSSSSR